jgi:hypothetical protein
MIYPSYTHDVKASIKAKLPNFATESPQQVEDSDWFPDNAELLEQAEDHRDEREAYEETIGKTERKMHTLFLVQSILEAKLDEMESDSFESLGLHVESLREQLRDYIDQVEEKKFDCYKKIGVLAERRKLSIKRFDERIKAYKARTNF